jgi:hypothetical protein
MSMNLNASASGVSLTSLHDGITPPVQANETP